MWPQVERREAEPTDAKPVEPGLQFRPMISEKYDSFIEG